MELWQAFLLGMMVAWTPGLIVLAILLRESKTARAHHALENPTRVDTGRTVCVGKTAPVTH